MDGNKLVVDIDDLSEMLSLPKSWLYEQTSPEGRKKTVKKGIQPLPILKVGKYVRFKVSAVEEWLEQFKS